MIRKNKTKKELTILLISAAAILVLYYFASCSRYNSPASNQLANFTETTGIYKSGVVVNASEKIITLQTEENEIFNFSVNENTVLDCKDEELGVTLDVEYEGEYSDFMIAKSLSEKESATREDIAVPDSISAEHGGSLTHTAGVVTDITKNYVTVAFGSGNKDVITINKGDSTVSDENIVIGDYIRAYYFDFSSINNPIAVNIRLVAKKSEQAAESQPMYFITGVLNSLDDKRISVSRNGNRYTLIRNETLISDEVSDGDTVRIYYCGSFKTGMTASCIEKISS